MGRAKQIYGLIGYPVKHSLSPLIHNTAFEASGIDAEYRLFEILPDDLESFLLDPDKKVRDSKGETVRAGDVLGFNVTIPHKVRAREILSRKFPLSKGNDQELIVEMIGAVNTVKRTAAGLDYRNTDAPGFLMSLREDLKALRVKGENVLVLGCGGAGRAVITGVYMQGGAKIYVFDPNAASVDSAKGHFYRFEDIKDKLIFIGKEEIDGLIKECRLLVNASPLGMKETDPLPLAAGLLHKDLFVYDVVYNRRTPLVIEAEKRAKASAGGLGMLLYQGVMAFEFWRDNRGTDIESIRRKLKEGLKS